MENTRMLASSRSTKVRDQADERFEVTAFYRVVKPRRPGIQADLNRNLRNRQGRDHRQTPAVHPFVLRREGAGQNG